MQSQSTLNEGSKVYLLSWNVDQLGASKRIKAVANAIASTEPDIVTLQEVRSKNADDVAEALEGRGLAHVWHSHDPRPCSDRTVEKGYHCVIASRWSLTDPPERDAWRCSAPFPEVLGRVTVKAPEGEVDVFTAHIPHGSGHGWKKIETFETLALALRSAGDSAARSHGRVSMKPRCGFCVRASSSHSRRWTEVTDDGEALRWRPDTRAESVDEWPASCGG